MPFWDRFRSTASQPSGWRYFTRAEFACRHCGRNLIADEFVTLLDELRHQAGFPLTVSSGYRCPVYNNQVSTTGYDGPHTTGHAADLTLSRHRAWDVLRFAPDLGFTGIGVQQKGGGRYLHLDTLTEPGHAPRPTVWSY